MQRPPPYLLGAALLFWGWQSGYTVIGLILGILIELPRWSSVRWDLTVEEFSRIWIFCTLLLLAGVVYAFTLNEGPSRFAEMFQDPDLRNQSRAGVSSARTAAALIRWLPIIFFLFVAAQQFSSRGGVPLETVSLILRRRWKRAMKEGKPPPPSRSVDISYIYFIVCLFSASIHSEEMRGFFWGAAVLLVWGLWPFRSPRFSIATWGAAAAAAVVLAWGAQRGMGQLQQYIENVNPQWLSSFQRGRFEASQSKTSLGQIGRIQTSPRIVVRLYAKDGLVPAYLREASYSTYKGATWFSVSSGQEFERVDEDPVGSSNFALVPGKTNVVTVELASFLPGRKGLLPLPPGSARLEKLPAFLLEKNFFGAVLAQGPGLVIFDAMFGPGPGPESPPSASELYAPVVPEREWQALDAVIDELQLRGKPRQEVLDTLERYFSGFTYSTWQDRVRGRSLNESPLSRFLLSTKKGHCEFFATATVLILQRLNIPARYSVGYVVHEPASSEKHYVVRQRDAHAWCLVWDEDRGIWRDFDTTPGTWIQVENNPTWQRKISDAWSRVVFEFLRIRWGQTRLREYILWVVVPILVLLLLQILFGKKRRAASQRRKGRDSTVWPGLDSEFYRIEKQLAARGFVRGSGEPGTQWLLRASGSIPELRACESKVRELLNLHYKYRFDPEGLNAEDRQQLREAAAEVLARLQGAGELTPAR